MAGRDVMGVEMIYQRGFIFLTADPDLFQQMIEANFVFCGWIAAVSSVGQRASQRMAGSVLRGIKMQTAMREFDATVRPTRDVGIMRDHQDGVTGFVQL